MERPSEKAASFCFKSNLVFVRVFRVISWFRLKGMKPRNNTKHTKIFRRYYAATVESSPFGVENTIMEFDLSRSIEVLAATPLVLKSLLGNLSEDWVRTEIQNQEWSPYDVIGHLIHGEETDWIPRARIILAQSENRTFVPFDRFAQFEKSKDRSLAQLLDEFARLRVENVDMLRSWNLTGDQLDLEGIHPELGRVTLRQLLATWVVHDLNHIRQIVTAMARRYDGEVGVWKEYLSILK